MVCCGKPKHSITGWCIDRATSPKLHVQTSNFSVRTANRKLRAARHSGMPYRTPSQALQILHDWISELRSQYHFSESDPLFPMDSYRSWLFPTVQGLEDWSSTMGWRILSSKDSQASILPGLPPFSQHRVRDTLPELASDHCRRL